MILKQSLARLRMRFNGAETALSRGTFTFSLRGLSGRAIEADAKLDDQMPNSLLSHTSSRTDDIQDDM